MKYYKKHMVYCLYENEVIETMTELNNNLEDLLDINETLDDHITKVTSMDLPLDWENVFEHDVDVSSIHVETASDGLVLSLANLGRVDIEYISKITDIPIKDVIKKLKGSIYQDPDDWYECFYKGWKTAIIFFISYFSSF